MDDGLRLSVNVLENLFRGHPSGLCVYVVSDDGTKWHQVSLIERLEKCLCRSDFGKGAWITQGLEAVFRRKDDEGIVDARLEG